MRAEGRHGECNGLKDEGRRVKTPPLMGIYMPMSLYTYQRYTETGANAPSPPPPPPYLVVER
jgi:hypothetical protein